MLLQHTQKSRAGADTGSCNVRRNHSVENLSGRLAYVYLFLLPITPATAQEQSQQQQGCVSPTSISFTPSPSIGRKRVPKSGYAGPALGSSSSQFHIDGPFLSELRSNFRTNSPSVARAFVTLPKFFFPPRAQFLGNRAFSMEQETTHQEQLQHHCDAQGQRQ